MSGEGRVSEYRAVGAVTEEVGGLRSVELPENVSGVSVTCTAAGRTGRSDEESNSPRTPLEDAGLDVEGGGDVRRGRRVGGIEETALESFERRGRKADGTGSPGKGTVFGGLLVEVPEVSVSG